MRWASTSTSTSVRRSMEGKTRASGSVSVRDHSGDRKSNLKIDISDGITDSKAWDDPAEILIEYLCR